MTVDDKRNFPRVTFHTTSEVRQGNLLVKGLVENLSLKGMFLVTDQVLNSDQPVGVSIFLNGANTDIAIRVKGDIGRVEERGMSIVFQEMELDSYILLKNVVFYADEELHEFTEFM